MKLKTQGETFQSVIGLNKTNLLLKNPCDLLLEAQVKMSGDRIFSKNNVTNANRRSTLVLR